MNRTEVYMKYRFALHVPARDLWFGAARVFNDPFDGTLWIGAAHKDGEPSLMQILSEEISLDVWLLRPGGARQGNMRRLKIHFGGDLTWFPLDLDARESGVAMDYVRLNHIIQSAPEDVPFDRCPEWIRRAADPRHTETSE